MAKMSKAAQRGMDGVLANWEKRISSIEIVGLDIPNKLQPDAKGNIAIVKFLVPKGVGTYVTGVEQIDGKWTPKKIDAYGIYEAKIRKSAKGRWFAILPVSASKGKFYNKLGFRSRFAPAEFYSEVVEDIKAGLLASFLWLIGENVIANPNWRVNMREACNVPGGGCRYSLYVGLKDDNEKEELAYHSQSIRDLLDQGALPQVLCTVKGQFCDTAGAATYTDLADKNIRRISRQKVIANAGGLVLDDAMVENNKVVIKTGDGEKAVTRWELGHMAQQEVAAECPFYCYKSKKGEGDSAVYKQELPSPHKTVPCSLVTTQTFALNADGTPAIDSPPVSIAVTKWEHGFLPNSTEVNCVHTNKRAGTATIRYAATDIFSIMTNGGFRIIVRGIKGLPVPSPEVVARYKAAQEEINSKIEAGRKTWEKKKEEQAAKTASQTEDYTLMVTKLDQTVNVVIASKETYSPEDFSKIQGAIDGKLAEIGAYFANMSKESQEIFRKVLMNWTQATK